MSARYKAGQLETMNGDPYFDAVQPGGECAWFVQIYDHTLEGHPIFARVYGSSPYEARMRAEAFLEALEHAAPPPAHQENDRK